MKRALHTFLILLLLSGAEAATADSFDDLIKDLDLLEEELLQQLADEERAAEDLLYERNPELFPKEDGSEENFEDVEDLPEDVPIDLPLDITIEEGGEDLVEDGSEEVEEDEEEQVVSDTHVSIQDGKKIVTLDDVPLDAWFGPFVRDVADLGIIAGYRNASGELVGKYGPGDNVTIAQLAKIASEATERDRSSCPEEPINEAAINSWSEEYISCAETWRWSVYVLGDVEINRPATRTEVVVTILQAFKRPTSPAFKGAFDDVTKDLPFNEYIELAAEEGIVTGYTDDNGNPTGQFGPFDKVNRAEIAKIVSIALELYGD